MVEMSELSVKQRLDQGLRKVEDLLDAGGTRKDIVLICISVAALVLSFFVPDAFPFNPG